jgi:hypothetical protein
LALRVELNARSNLTADLDRHIRAVPAAFPITVLLQERKCRNRGYFVEHDGGVSNTNLVELLQLVTSMTVEVGMTHVGHVTA